MRNRAGVALVLIVAALGAAGCAARVRCSLVNLPIYWSDGSTSSWSMTVCAAGRVTVRPGRSR